MKNKRKLGFRIYFLFSIVLFLLIPLLSSPVAAVNNCTGMSVTTTCGPSGSPISITVTNPTITTFNDDNSLTIKVDCEVLFQDLFTTTRVNSSQHDSTLWAVVKPGYSGSVGPTDATGIVILDDGETYNVTLSIYLYAISLPCIWQVYLDTLVKDLKGTDQYQYTRSWNITLQ